jgi:hypothetical protein
VEAEPEIYSLDSKALGATYSQWLVKYWVWITSIPKANDPHNAVTAKQCSMDQPSKGMWYLAESYSGPIVRNCIIPENRTILIPILTGECDYLTDPSIKDERTLAECAWGGISNPVIKLSIDGKEIQNVSEYKVQSSLFNVTLAEDRVYGMEGFSGNTQGVIGGYVVILKPLTPGKHEIQFSASIIDNPLLGTYSYASDTKYNIAVNSDNKY